MIHTDGSRTIANAPAVTDENLVTDAGMGVGKTEFGLKLCDPARPEKGWRRVNEQVRDATANG